MKTDRELLELAAKAAGLWDAENGCIDMPWNPLNVDGDAFRLMVKLRLDVCRPRSRHAEACVWDDAIGDFICEPDEPDPCAATRRVIVRAAASFAEVLAEYRRGEEVKP